MKSLLLVSAFFKENESLRNIIKLNNIDHFIIIIITRLYLQNSCHKQIIKFTLRRRNEINEVVTDYPINEQCLLHIEASQSIFHYSAALLLESFTVSETYNLKVTLFFRAITFDEPFPCHSKLI